MTLRRSFAAKAPLIATTLFAVAGCSGGEPLAQPAASPVPPVRASNEPQPQVASQSFAAWRSGFRTRALANGIRPDVFEAAFAGVGVNRQVLNLDSKQSEFTRTIWAYLDSAVSASRIDAGRQRAASKQAELASIEARYGVPSEIVLAVWGIESAYGANFGDISVIESLATLAYEGRRRDFAEEQLIAALKILQAGDISPERMVGSWAGAMGHTQFIPTSFLEYAVDHTGDARRDIWAPDAIDALASTANYLASFGWRAGEPVIVEVRLPGGFDYRLADDRTSGSAADWTAKGVTAVRGTLPPGDAIRLLLPAGASGPAFATYPNFRVIKRYNNATSYALAVAHLGERISGGAPFVQSWPRTDRALSRTEKQELQRRLTSLGFDTDGIDGIIGPNSRAAVRRFQTASGLTPDGYVSASLLEAVRAAGS